MFFCSLIEELCTKEGNDKTGCKLNFGHECTLHAFCKFFYKRGDCVASMRNIQKNTTPFRGK